MTTDCDVSIDILDMIANPWLTWHMHTLTLQFVREELEYEDNFDRQARFHGSDDHITVNDLWHLWVQSEGLYL